MSSLYVLNKSTPLVHITRAKGAFELDPLKALWLSGIGPQGLGVQYMGGSKKVYFTPTRDLDLFVFHESGPALAADIKSAIGVVEEAVSGGNIDESALVTVQQAFENALSSDKSRWSSNAVVDRQLVDALSTPFQLLDINGWVRDFGNNREFLILQPGDNLTQLEGKPAVGKGKMNMHGGMLAYRRMKEAKHCVANRSCFNQTAGFHSHYFSQFPDFYKKVREPMQLVPRVDPKTKATKLFGIFNGVDRDEGIKRYEQALGAKAKKYTDTNNRSQTKPPLRDILVDAQKNHYAGTVHMRGHIFPWTYDPEVDKLAFWDIPQQKEIKEIQDYNDSLEDGEEEMEIPERFVHIDANTLPEGYHLGNLAEDTHDGTYHEIESINVYEIPVSTAGGVHRFFPKLMEGAFIPDPKPNPDENFDDPEFEEYMNAKYPDAAAKASNAAAGGPAAAGADVGPAAVGAAGKGKPHNPRKRWCVA